MKPTVRIVSSKRSEGWVDMNEEDIVYGVHLLWAPVVEQPVVEQPVVEQPVVEQPVVEQPVAEPERLKRGRPLKHRD